MRAVSPDERNRVKIPQLPFHKRLVFPVLTVTLVMSISWMGYNGAWRLENRMLHHLLGSLCGGLLFISVTFGALFIYPRTFFNGAVLYERVLACLANPFLWATKECLRLATSFSLAECLYYYLNPLSLWLFFGVTAQLGLMEIVCRQRLRRRGLPVTVFSPAALTVAAVSLLLVVSLYAWGQGENVYVLFLKGYRQLFGAGVGVAAAD